MRKDGTPWQVIHRAIGDDPRTLDPQVSYDTLGNAVIAQVYESMLQYHPFKTNPYELSPCLLESMPVRQRRSDGGETWTFKLKKGIFFHADACFLEKKDRELVAGDMAYVFQRLADPAVECPVLSTLQEYLPGLGEAYEKAKKKGSFDYSQPIQGVEVVDSHQFRLHLSKPFPQVLYWMASPFTAPVPREAVEYYDGKIHDGIPRPLFKFHPVGTGPFYVAENQKKQMIRLVRHEKYRATTFPMEGWDEKENERFRSLAGEPIPFIDEVQFLVIRESIPRWLLFRQGYLDVSGVNKDVFNNVMNVSLELTPEYRARGMKLYRNEEPATFYAVFNMEDPVIGGSRKLRQAISSAYDQERANELFSNGIDINAQQFLPPGLFGFQPGYRNPYKQHDLKLARQLMVEAGYPNGNNPKTGQPLEINMDVMGDSAEGRQMIEFMKGQVEQLGIRLNLVENNWARFQDKMINGGFQIMYGSGWNADYPDPENFFFLFYGKNIPPQGHNTARYRSPEFDKAFEKMRTLDNTPERLALIHRMNDLLVEDCPFLLQNHEVYYSLAQAWAPRITSNAQLVGGLKYARIDSSLRDRQVGEWNRPVLWPLWLGMGGVVSIGLFGFWWRRRQHD